jgi:hypothetical protein
MTPKQTNKNAWWANKVLSTTTKMYEADFFPAELFMCKCAW